MNGSVPNPGVLQREGQSLGTTEELAQDRAPVPACRAPQLAGRARHKTQLLLGPWTRGAQSRCYRKAQPGSFEVEPDALSRALACSPTYFQVSVKLLPFPSRRGFKDSP